MNRFNRFILIPIGLLMLWGCQYRRGIYESSMPEDFNFVAKIEDESFILNTYEDKLTKTIDWDVDTTITYYLSEKDKKSIYQIMKNIDIHRYPSNYAPISVVSISPSFSYYIKFTLNEVDYTINWVEHTESTCKDAKELRSLFLNIQDCFIKDKRVNELPESERYFF